MGYKCDVCNLELATPAALGSHKRTHKAKREVKGSSGEPVTVKIVVEQATSRAAFPLYTCPECGRELELMTDSVGIYKLKCLKCWEGG